MLNKLERNNDRATVVSQWQPTCVCLTWIDSMFECTWRELAKHIVRKVDAYNPRRCLGEQRSPVPVTAPDLHHVAAGYAFSEPVIGLEMVVQVDPKRHVIFQRFQWRKSLTREDDALRP